MAEPKKDEAPSLDGHKFAWAVVFLAIVLFAFTSIIETNGFLNRVLLGNESETGNDSFSIDDFLPNSGTSFSGGEDVVSKGDTKVRVEPGGGIVGLQPTGSKGKILQGPMPAFNENWYRIDFEDAPDGWVIADDISTHTFVHGVLNFIPSTLGFLRPLAILLSIIILVLIGIIYFKKRSLIVLATKKKEMKKNLGKESQKISPSELPIPNLPVGNEKPKTVDVTNKRWIHVETLMNSHSSNDWRQAIIESDIILEEMLERMGYEGKSIGDKLKTVEESDFLTLNQAWEAHKIRNRIAHKGSDYVLSRDEADKAIRLYSEVFKEFYYI